MKHRRTVLASLSFVRPIRQAPPLFFYRRSIRLLDGLTCCRTTPPTSVQGSTTADHSRAILFETSRGQAALLTTMSSIPSSEKSSSPSPDGGGGDGGGTAVCWFRKGLRLHDNRALIEACDSKSVYPLFVWDSDPASPETRTGRLRYTCALPP